MELKILKKYTTRTIERTTDVLLPKRFCCKQMQRLLSMFHYGSNSIGKNHHIIESFDNNIAVYRMFNYLIEEFKFCPFCGEKFDIWVGEKKITQ